jgi:hypothetical protein
MLGIEHAFLFGDDGPLFLECLDAALGERPPLVLGLGPVQLGERLGRLGQLVVELAQPGRDLGAATAIASTQTRWPSASSAPITLATSGSSSHGAAAAAETVKLSSGRGPSAAGPFSTTRRVPSTGASKPSGRPTPSSRPCSSARMELHSSGVGPGTRVASPAAIRFATSLR